LRDRRTTLEKKRVYEKPVLRKVRLEVKTSVLGDCHTSTFMLSDTLPLGCAQPLSACVQPSP
jgi:hypothetical protein